MPQQPPWERVHYRVLAQCSAWHSSHNLQIAQILLGKRFQYKHPQNVIGAPLSSGYNLEITDKRVFDILTTRFTSSKCTCYRSNFNNVITFF